jgi:hypothetical protein
MATTAIGSLRIDLALSTAKFKEGAKKAQEMSRKLADRIKKHSKTIKNAFKAAALAAAAFAAGLALAVRGSLKEFDKLAKMSRSVGVPVEQLSALGHAAELSGASVDDLGKAFRNVARNAQGAARGPNDFSRSLDSLGVKWREANGQFVQADQLMLAVADKFKGMADGAGKTALAMKIFGEERGPKLVSFLNAGSAGIREMTAEAEQLGLVIGSKAAVQAERFNDNVSRLGKVVTGFGNDLTQRLLPALNNVVQGFVDFAERSKAAKIAAEGVAFIVKGLVEGIYRLGYAASIAGVRTRVFFEDMKDAATLSWDEIIKRNRIADAHIRKMQGDLAYDLRELWKEAGDTIANAMSGGASADAGGTALVPSPIVTSRQAETDATREFNEAEAERKRIIEEMRTPEEAMIARQERLRELFQGGARDADTYGRAMAKASAFSAKNMQALAGTVSSALGQIFGESKAAAIGQALISTYAGIAKAIETYPPPISTAMAAIQAAAGFAQVANIRRTTKSGGGGSGSSAGASAGAGAAAAPAQAAAPVQQQAVNVTLNGSNFGREQVFGLIDSINDAMSDGKQLIISAA